MDTVRSGASIGLAPSVRRARSEGGVLTPFGKCLGDSDIRMLMLRVRASFGDRRMLIDRGSGDSGSIELPRSLRRATGIGVLLQSRISKLWAHRAMEGRPVPVRVHTG